MKRKLARFLAFLIMVVPMLGMLACTPEAHAASYGSVSVSSETPGTGATNLGKAQNNAVGSTDTGVAPVYKRQDGNDTAYGTNGNYIIPSANDVGNAKVQIEPSRKTTYVCVVPKFTPIASATDMVQIYGSGTKTIKILLVELNYVATTTASSNDFYLIKRSTANTGGTATTPTALSLDSNNAASTAVVKYYASGSNPTTGTTVANLMMASLNPTYTNVASGLPAWQVLYDWRNGGQACTLRGTGEGLVLNNNSQTLGGTSATIAMRITYTEE